LLSKGDPSLASDLFKPRSSGIPASLLEYPAGPDWASTQKTRELWGGLYVQYQLAIADRLYLLSGARFDNVWENVKLSVSSSTTGPTFPAESQSNKLRGLKQREGILWHLATPLSLYANYTENFGAAPGLYVSAAGENGLFAPQQSAHEWEAGLKFEPPGGR